MKKLRQFMSMLLSLFLCVDVFSTTGIKVQAVEAYDLWVGGEQVTSANCDNITSVLGEGAKASYDRDSKTLTLENVTGFKDAYTFDPVEDDYGDESYIYIYSKDDLTIDGEATIVGSECDGIWVPDKTLTIKGKIEFKDNNNFSYNEHAIIDADDIYVEGGDIYVSGDYQMYNGGAIGCRNLYISSGTVFASWSKRAVNVGDKLTMTGGTLEATNTVDEYAVYFSEYEWGDDVEIKTPAGGTVLAQWGGMTIANSEDIIADHVIISGFKEYDLWVGDTQVTSENKDDILGDSKASYNPSGKVLTLDDPEITITTEDALIRGKDLNLIKGKATLVSDTATGGIMHPYSDSDTLKIDADLTVKTRGQAIAAGSNLEIAGGNIICEGTGDSGIGIIALLGSLSITGGTVNAKGSIYGISCGGAGGEKLSVTGGSVEASGDGAAVYCGKNGTIEIASGLLILEPENGKIQLKTINDTEGYVITDDAGNVAKSVDIGTEKAVYTVTFDMGGKAANVTENVEKGQSVSSPSTDPEAEGYVFTGWFADEECTTEYNFDTPVKKDTTIFAGWREASKFTVTFSANKVEAKDMPEAQTIEEGKTVTKPVEDPAADGYTFTGWFADEDCTTEYDFKTVITKNTTIYAGWKEGNDPAKGLTVSFNMMDHGSAIPAQTVSLNGTVEQPDNPSEEGWVFGGWFKEEGCVNEYNFNDPVKENFTLYAKWTEEIEAASKGISALDNRPVIDENTTDIYLVKGQKFFIGKEWAVADKVAKTYVNIDKKGYLKAKKANPESVTVKIKKEGRADITVHICQPALSDKKKTLIIDDADKKTDFTLSISKDDGIKNVLWYSAAPDVATVDQNGKVTAVAQGKAKITAYVNGKAYNCTITVKESVAAKNRTMHVNLDGSKSIKVKGVRNWTSADETIATKAEKGEKFTAKSAGKTVLSASVNDIKYTIDFYGEDITVKCDKISSANKNKYTINDLKVGTATDISLPGVKQDVVFKSSKPDVAFIDENGHIEARSKGKAKLTTKINGKTITILVVVNE